MAILITGGAGAIGSRLASALIDNGQTVVILDDLSSGHEENLHPKAIFVEHSVESKEILLQLWDVYHFEYVYHLAALFANQNSIDHPARDLIVNGLGTLNVLQAAKNRKELKRLVFASSSCVYGPHVGPIPETASLALDTPYAATKLLGEHYLKLCHKYYNVPGVILRLFNSYGPGERPGKYRNVIPNFIARALGGEPLTITGTGLESRDFTYVGDVVTAFVLASEVPGAIGHTFNVASGQETQIVDLARAILEATDSDSRIDFLPRRSWDTTEHRCGDISLAKHILGYESRTELPVGLAQTVSWFRTL